MKDRFCLSFHFVTIYLARVKFFLMKKLFIFLMALALPVFALKMSAEDENVKIEVPLRMESTTKLVRGFVEEQLLCHYYGQMNCIVTTALQDMGDVSLTVVNTSTGSVWYDSFDSALEPQTALTLSGEPGIYQIVYITESGGVYDGTFTIQ